MIEMGLQVIQHKIQRLPQRPPCMLAQDLAEVYETETKRINEAVKRNPDRFPEDFYFQLTDDEVKQLKLQDGTLENVKSHFATLHSPRANPYAFTEEGCNMLATVLKTPVAAQRAVQIIRVFGHLRKAMLAGLVAVAADEVVIKQAALLALQQRVIEAQANEWRFALQRHGDLQRDNFRHPVTDAERHDILTLHRQGERVRIIADIVNRPKSTVWAVLRRERRSQ